MGLPNTSNFMQNTTNLPRVFQGNNRKHNTMQKGKKRDLAAYFALFSPDRARSYRKYTGKSGRGIDLSAFCFSVCCLPLARSFFSYAIPNGTSDEAKSYQAAVVLKGSVLCRFFLGNNFFAVVKAAISANSVGSFQLVAMRALDERRRLCLIIRKAFVRSALRLFCLGNCHLSHLFS